MKLKTLKDFKVPGPNGELPLSAAISESELRQEAIKHIKEMRISDIYSESEQGTFDTNYNVQEWIKDFFNITEEELK